MAPSQIGPYPILGELGPGLIGVYYHSHDERRGRDVTIKALSPEGRRARGRPV